MHVPVGLAERELSDDARRSLEDIKRNGVGVLRSLVRPRRVAELLAESERLWKSFVPGGPSNLRFGIRRDLSGKPILERLDPVADVSPPFAELNDDSELVSLAQIALGGPVIVMKEKLVYKWPGTPGFGLHRDAAYNTPRTGVPGNGAFTVAIALDPVTAATGPTEFFPELRNVALPAPPDEPRDVDESAVVGIASFRPELQPGDALLFDGLVPHRSGRNSSDRPRRLYMVTFVPARYTQARERYYAARVKEEALSRGIEL